MELKGEECCWRGGRGGEFPPLVSWGRYQPNITQSDVLASVVCGILLCCAPCSYTSCETTLGRSVAAGPGGDSSPFPAVRWIEDVPERRICADGAASLGFLQPGQSPRESLDFHRLTNPRADLIPGDVLCRRGSAGLCVWDVAAFTLHRPVSTRTQSEAGGIVRLAQNSHLLTERQLLLHKPFALQPSIVTLTSGFNSAPGYSSTHSRVRPTSPGQCRGSAALSDEPGTGQGAAGLVFPPPPTTKTHQSLSADGVWDLAVHTLAALIIMMIVLHKLLII